MSKVRVIPMYACLWVEASWLSSNMWIIAVLLVGSLLLLAWLTWAMCYRQQGHRSALVQVRATHRGWGMWTGLPAHDRMRPAIQSPAAAQGIINLRKHMTGAPTGGIISVVTTDIEGYSGLCTLRKTGGRGGKKLRRHGGRGGKEEGGGEKRRGEEGKRGEREAWVALSHVYMWL